jgi:hypothetical protein
MKRIFILLVVALLFAGAVFAEEAILIDFTKLAADIIPAGSARRNTLGSLQSSSSNFAQNRQTVMDFGQSAGNSFTQDQKDAMKTSLAIENWDVVLSTSSRTIANVTNSYTREAPSNQWGTVMGVRVHFPLENFYSKATIKPPFEIPAFEAAATIDDNGVIQPNPPEYNNLGFADSRFENDYGVVKNVGTIRSVAVNVYGLKFPHGLYTILIDDKGNEKPVFMGYLNFDGWAELTWQNPQYIMDVRVRELRLYPLYPTNTPFVKFGGFRIDRDADTPGGDFITYFKDVKIIYDKAVLETDRDIKDEQLWNIIRDRETDKMIKEMDRFGYNAVERWIDTANQATETFDPLRGTDVQSRYGFTPTPAQ